LTLACRRTTTWSTWSTWTAPARIDHAHFHAVARQTQLAGGHHLIARLQT
jgi:hypothetical protein